MHYYTGLNTARKQFDQKYEIEQKIGEEIEDDIAEEEVKEGQEQQENTTTLLISETVETQKKQEKVEEEELGKNLRKNLDLDVDNEATKPLINGSLASESLL